MSGTAAGTATGPATGPGGTVLHCYGLVRPDPAPRLPEVGIGGAPVFLVPLGDLAALASELPAATHGPPVWEAHADDPQWLGQVAAQHNAVLEAVVDRTDVLPLRLPGLYGDRAALEAALTEHVDQFRGALAAVEGHVEWGLKVFLRQEPDEAPEPAPSSGRDYLLRKASEGERKQAARERRTSALLDVHGVLAESATHAVVNPPQDGALTGRPEPMLLNAAYLVPRAARDDFLALAEEVGARLWDDGMSVEVTGPWPPYNFADGEARTAGTR